MTRTDIIAWVRREGPVCVFEAAKACRREEWQMRLILNAAVEAGELRRSMKHCATTFGRPHKLPVKPIALPLKLISSVFALGELETA